MRFQITTYPSSSSASAPIAKKTVSADFNDFVLNYNGQTYNKGLPCLVKWIRGHVKKYHLSNDDDDDEERTDVDVCVSSGSTDALHKCVQLLTEPGDVLLAAEYCYTGILVSPRAHGREVVGVSMDENGILPDALDKICGAITRTKRRTPTLLYVVPTGQNPTGSTMPASRRRQVYDVCRKHNLIIIEDDPYFFLEMNAYGTHNGKTDDAIERTPSFLSMDTDGRVIRLDSFAKTIAPGFRLGFVTGPDVFVEKLDQMNQITTWSSSGIAQTVLSALLNEWGEDGFEAHAQALRRTYERRRDALLDAMEKHLRGTIASWSPPSAGMFVWIRLRGVRDTRDCLDWILNDARVVMIPGGVFQPDADRACPFFRATFATAPIASFDGAMERLATALKAYEARRRSDELGRVCAEEN